ncbi:unnamed protein product [Allacma fusca]|uniref:Uncharacterized protein n=1 Tax=Allacma fusca TaxID=39272 RepID=A0A8J2LJN2_9HEXA|nr:unnamed protein product [Allacma fusca]
MLDTNSQARTARCLRMFRSKSWVIHLVVAIGFFYQHLISTSSVGATSTYNFIANQRPRFQIPHGNLSYYRSPQWEVLYYLKFGVFPFYSSSSPYLNRTQYLNKIRLIKNLMDRKGEETVGAGNDLVDSEHNETSDTFVAKLSHEPLQLMDRPSSSAGGMVEAKKTSRNFYYPLATLKKNVRAPKAKRDGSFQTVNDFQIVLKNKLVSEEAVVDCTPAVMEQVSMASALAACLLK